MASVDKFTDSEIIGIIRHDMRIIQNPSNTDIDTERTQLNYSFDTNHEGKNDYQYYKEILDHNYMYSRGTKRENETITACGWVVTLPQEITGYKELEDEFFKGVYSFISERYGEENIINNRVHYDEAGQPHIHVVFVPITELNHEQVQYKTVRSKTAIKLESGRYEYEYRYKLQDGSTVPIKDFKLENEVDNRIPAKNYARVSDYYDYKISATDVMNKAELQHFHKDLQRYLDENNIAGNVINGKTGDKNYSVKELKEITYKTGLTLDDIKQLQTLKFQDGINDILDYTENLTQQNQFLQESLNKEQALNLNLKNECEKLKKELMENRQESLNLERDRWAYTDKRNVNYSYGENSINSNKEGGRW